MFRYLVFRVLGLGTMFRDAIVIFGPRTPHLQGTTTAAAANGSGYGSEHTLS